jgi:hypothetical protein
MTQQNSIWNCPKCNAEVDAGFDVCWDCGTGCDGTADPDFAIESASIVDVDHADIPSRTPRCPEAHAPLSGRTRFFLHMTVASLLAPAVGAAVPVFCTTDRPLLNFPLVVIHGVWLSFYIWFITLPFGLITYGLCMVLRNVGVTRLVDWALVGTVAGFAFGWFILPPNPPPIMSYVGSATGFAAGLILWKVWQMDRTEEIPANPQNIPKIDQPNSPPPVDKLGG